MSYCIVKNHERHNLITRSRWEHELHPNGALPAGVPAAHAARPLWLYNETRAVVLIDLRRGSLFWSRQPHDVLDTVLAALAAGPPNADAAAELTVHLTVALCAREGWPLRVLVQGYRQTCGESCKPLLALVHEQLRHALGEAEPAVPAPTTARGLHSCIRDGLFILSLLPACAAPALALLTDAVGSPIDAPLLGLRQLDVSLALILCIEPEPKAPPPGNAARRGGASAAGPTPMGPSHPMGPIPAGLAGLCGGDTPFGLIADPESHQRAAEDVAGLILRPTGATTPKGWASARDCIAKALMLRSPCRQAAVSEHLSWLSFGAPLQWRLPSLRSTSLAITPRAADAARRHRERLHMYQVPSAITLADLLHARIGEGFRLIVDAEPQERPPFLERAGSAANSAANGAAANGAAASTGAANSGDGSRAPEDDVVMRLCCEWGGSDAVGHGITIEYMVRSVRSRPMAASSSDSLATAAGAGADSAGGAAGAGSAVSDASGAGGASGAAAGTNAAADSAEAAAGAAAARVPPGASVTQPPGPPPGSLRVYVSVLAPLPFWLRFERARLHRRQHSWAERSDAAALQTFVERVRHRDRRLARLAAAMRGGEREWHAALESGALGDSILMPKLALEYTLLPSSRPSAHIAAGLTVRTTTSLARGDAAPTSTVRLHLKVDEGCSTIRWDAWHRLRPALASIMGVSASSQYLAHVWHPPDLAQRLATGEGGRLSARSPSRSARNSERNSRTRSDSTDSTPRQSAADAPDPVAEIMLSGAARMAFEEASAPWAMVVRLTVAESGMATIFARGFRSERPAAREAMLRLWRQVTDRAKQVARETDVWQVRAH